MPVEKFMGTGPQWAFMSTVIVEGVVVLAMVAIAFSFVEADVVENDLPTYKTLPCYFSLFGLATLFTIYTGLDALWNRNIIELIGIPLFSVGLCIFSGLQVREVKDALVLGSDCTTQNQPSCDALYGLIERFLIVVPIIIFLAILSYTWWTMKLYGEFGWAVFSTVGADPAKKNMYRFYEVFVCLLKFDYFAAVALFMQLLILVPYGSQTEFRLTIAAIPISLILLVGCGWSVKNEIRSLFVISLALMLASMGYVVYKLTRFYGPNAANYATTRTTLTFFAICTLLLLITSFLIGLVCLTFFGKGMKDAHRKSAGKRHLFARRTTGLGNGTAAGQSEKTGVVDGEELERQVSIE